MKHLKYAAILVVALLVSTTGNSQLGNLKSIGKKIMNETGKTNKDTKTENGSQQTSEPAQEKKGIGNAIENVTGQELPSKEEKQSIIFSKTPFDPLQPPSESVKEFSAGDHIYAVAYLQKPVRDLYENVQPNQKLDVEIFIYTVRPPLYSYQSPLEEQLTFVSMRVAGSILQNKYLVIDIAPEPDKTTAYTHPEIIYKEFGKKFDGPVNFCESLAKLPAGENTLKFVVKCYYAESASGKMKISGNDFSFYKSLSEKLNLGAQSAGAANALMPKALKKDPALEAQMIAAVKKSNDWANGRFDATDILRIVILDADWTIRRHEISGAILHRYIRAAIAVKTKDGNCAYYNLVTFQEDYIGGKFQPLKYDGAGDKVMMSCENVNK